MESCCLSEIAEACLATQYNELPLVSRFLDQSFDVPRYIIGRNSEAELAIERIKFDGVIDDGNGAPKTWSGLPVYKMSKIEKHAWVLNCSTSIAPVAVIRSLRENGISNIVNLSELCSNIDFREYLQPWFVRQQRKDFENHAHHWQDLYDSLADDESRRTLLDVFRFRLSANPEYMDPYKVRLSEQYFEPFLKLDGETFVDAGGYDGDTTEIFCQHDPGYNKVYFFEPSHKNLQLAKVRLKELCNIDFLQLGLSDKGGSLAFDEEAGSSSSVQSSGELTIKVDKLDDCVLEPVSFIKMDLEGWELHALAGAEQHIRNDTPKLAIAVYHDASHFWEVKQLVTSLYPEYKIRLRHYTQGWSETIMFFTKN